jgi:hypothetical protein
MFLLLFPVSVSKNLYETVKKSYAVFWLQTCVIINNMNTANNYQSIISTEFQEEIMFFLFLFTKQCENQ